MNVKKSKFRKNIRYSDFAWLRYLTIHLESHFNYCKCLNFWRSFWLWSTFQLILQGFALFVGGRNTPHALQVRHFCSEDVDSSEMSDNLANQDKSVKKSKKMETGKASSAKSTSSQETIKTVERSAG